MPEVRCQEIACGRLMAGPVKKYLTIIGAGLAGSEAAWQAAERGIPVVLYEMRSNPRTPVHKTDFCAELVCSNSLGNNQPCSAPYILKEIYPMAVKVRQRDGKWWAAHFSRLHVRCWLPGNATFVRGFRSSDQSDLYCG